MEKPTHWRDFVPTLMVLVIAFISPYLLPSGMREIAPPLAFAALFYFVRQCPQLELSVWVVAITGLLLDMQQAMPIGVGISASILLYCLASWQQQRKELPSFSSHFAYFFAISFIIMAWIYGLMSLLHGHLFPLEAPILQWLLLLFSYPLIYSLCRVTNREMTATSSARI